MSYSGVSVKLSTYLAQELGFDDEKRLVIAYSIDNILITLLGLLLITLAGLVLGSPLEVLAVAISGGLLRKFSGGAHFNSPYTCLLTGALVYSLTGWLIAQSFTFVSANPAYLSGLVILTFINVLLVLIYAPVDSSAKPIVSPVFKRKLRVFSLVLVIALSMSALVFYQTSYGFAVIIGFSMQCITLLPLLNGH